MAYWKINFVDVTADDTISYEEAFCHVMDELARWGERGKNICSINLKMVNEKEIELQAYETLPSKRINRLTRCAC